MKWLCKITNSHILIKHVSDTHNIELHYSTSGEYAYATEYVKKTNP